MSVVVAVDQGTSSTKGIAVNEAGVVVGHVTVYVSQTHPKPGWVEQSAQEILDSVKTVLVELAQGLEEPIAAVGLSTQRESAVVWDGQVGAPLGPVVGWQDRRTTEAVEALRAAGVERDLTNITGLPVDPMFSAPKMKWLMDEVNSPAAVAGTVDNWLVYSLTGNHHIEYGNASRTLLLDLETCDWSDRAADLFGVPIERLGNLQPSNSVTGAISGIEGYEGVPIAAVLADSHAALFGHGVREPGMVKATYGTGSSVLGLTNVEPIAADALARTIAWFVDGPQYALEGNILSTGSTLVWLAELLGTETSELWDLAAGVEVEEAMAKSKIDIVPAFSGLAAPWWDQHAEAIVTGLSLGDTTERLAFAAVESITWQIEDVLRAMEKASGQTIDTTMADGGPSANAWLMQLQADASQRTIVASGVAELSALGAAHLAGTTVGLWDSAQVETMERKHLRCVPKVAPELADARHQRWSRAVARSRFSADSSEEAGTPSRGSKAVSSHG